LVKGDTFTDLSDNNLTVTAIDGASVDTVTTKFADGSMSFDGVDDTVSIANDTALDLSSGDWTIECWCYHIGQMTTGTGLFGKRRLDTSYGPYMCGSEANSDPTKALVYLGSNSGSAWNAIIVGTTDFPLDQWVHFAITRSGNVYTMWQNGVSIGTTTVSGNLMTVSNPLIIGQSLANEGAPSSATWWNGYIEDFRITKGLARYTEAFTLPTASFPTR